MSSGRTAAPGAQSRPGLLEPRDDQVGQQRERDERGGRERQQHRRARGYRPPAARGKKITRSASRGTSCERAHHPAPRRRPSPVAAGHGGPQPRVELPAELLDQPLLVLGELDIALRDQHLAMAWLHPQKAHRVIMSKPRASAELPRRPWASRARPGAAAAEHVDRPGAGADLASARRGTAGRGSALATRAALSGSSPQASRAASTEECVQPEPWAAPPGGARPGSRPAASRRRTTSIACSRWPPVTTTQRGPSAWSARAAPALARPPVAPAPASPTRAGARASGRFGVITVARGSSRATSAARAAGSSSSAPDSATITGSSTTGVPAGSSSSASDHGLDRRRVAEHSDLHGVDPDVLRDRAHLGDDHLRRDCVDGGHADRVLRGDRGDRGHPVDAAGRERLQVGLDAGAAAGVRAGDREHAGIRRRSGSRAPVGHGHERTAVGCRGRATGYGSP